MMRFFHISMVWMVVSFALLWHVQRGVDEMFLHAAQAIGKTIGAQRETPTVSGDGQEAAILAEAMKQRQTGEVDLARLEFDRRELMRRLRTLWLVVTLVPLLFGTWWAAGKNKLGIAPGSLKN